VNIENYVGGVVEAEAGKDRPLEYYKVQSIISRTYALANFRRHATEGFQLCDQVHCQVYQGECRYEPLIPVGVMKTKGIVLVDSEISLITASFSSNCGGKTRNSEEVWSKPLSYLKSVSDTFCLNGDHATWKKSISRRDWENHKKHNTINASFKAGKGASMDDTFSEFLYWKQDLNAIRTYFKLNSTRFVIEENANTVNFLGQGFGHGVGLCQEGAIRMAELGYSYKEILELYYTDVHLIQLSTLEFFKSD
jgi:stage II sporulation protein D